MALSAFELCEDTFGMSRDDLESIIAFLRSAESRQMSHSDVEKLVRERSYELSRKLFQAHVDSRGPGEAAAPVRGADGVERDQERIHERGLTTIFGEIRVKRFGYGGLFTNQSVWFDTDDRYISGCSSGVCIEYDAYGNVTKTTDIKGGQTTIVYDSSYNIFRGYPESS